MEGRREAVKAKILAENKSARSKSARLSPLELSHEGKTHPKNHPPKQKEFAQTVCANNFGTVCTHCPPFPFKISRKQTKEFAQTVCTNCFYLGGWFFGWVAFPWAKGCRNSEKSLCSGYACALLVQWGPECLREDWHRQWKLRCPPASSKFRFHP